MPPSIPPFLLPRGLPTRTTLRTLQSRKLSSTPVLSARNKKPETNKSRILEKPDKFRPPSHPQRLVTPVARTPSGQPLNYGPRLSSAEREAQNKKQYPNMFPPEGTVMFKFLTSRWIHIWIAMVRLIFYSSLQIASMNSANKYMQSILTTLATFTFTTNFKATSPFAHLLPPWSGLLTDPFNTVSQAISVFKMDKQHNSVLAREHRQRRVNDAEKRRQYRVAHGMEEPSEEDKAGQTQVEAVDPQSPIAVEAEGETYVDFDGNKKPVKKWFGIW